MRRRSASERVRRTMPALSSDREVVREQSSRTSTGAAEFGGRRIGEQQVVDDRQSAGIGQRRDRSAARSRQLNLPQLYIDSIIAELVRKASTLSLRYVAPNPACRFIFRSPSVG